MQCTGKRSSWYFYGSLTRRYWAVQDYRNIEQGVCKPPCDPTTRIISPGSIGGWEAQVLVGRVCGVQENVFLSIGFRSLTRRYWAVQDYRNIEQGVYALPWDMTTSGHRQWSPFWVAQRTAQVPTLHIL